jgi:hypothetical protein
VSQPFAASSTGTAGAQTVAKGSHSPTSRADGCAQPLRAGNKLMAKRPKQSDILIDAEDVLKRLGACRRELVASMVRMQINGQLYSATSELLVAIDALASVLTGSRDQFHGRAHG